MLTINRGEEEVFFEVFRNNDLWKHFKKWIRYYYKGKTSNYYDYQDGDLAITKGYLSLIKERNNLRFSDLAIEYAAEKGYLQLVKDLHGSLRSSIRNIVEAMKGAVKNNHLEVVEFLYWCNPRLKCFSDLMVLGAQKGHLEIIKFFHKYNAKDCTTYVMDYASGEGQLEIVRWLHENSKAGCTTLASGLAIEYGHIEVVKFLYYNRRWSFTSNSGIEAIKNGHLEVVKFLFSIGLGFHPDIIMEYAVPFNQPGIIKWLHSIGVNSILN